VDNSDALFTNKKPPLSAGGRSKIIILLCFKIVNPLYGELGVTIKTWKKLTKKSQNYFTRW